MRPSTCNFHDPSKNFLAWGRNLEILVKLNQQNFGEILIIKRKNGHRGTDLGILANL